MGPKERAREFPQTPNKSFPDLPVGLHRPSPIWKVMPARINRPTLQGQAKGLRG